MPQQKYIVAISGASGAAYGLAIIKALADLGKEVGVTISGDGMEILREECWFDWTHQTEGEIERRIESDLKIQPGSITYYAEDNMYAPIASGSHRTAAMFVAPCSMKTLSGIANGYADTLLERAADVAIKEKRPLVLVPRETPLSPIHLENMLKLSRIGVHILAAMPAFYNKPKTIDDLINNIAGRALDLAGVDNGIYKRWE
jgi:flavin prenyltransferase